MAETPTNNNEEIELSLGLSLNGRFGVDPRSSKNNLTRSASSSVSNFLEISSCTPLTRTCSLPVDAEEETRKRKEMQMLRRLEAKRKRLEKQRRENGLGDKLENNGKLDFLVNGVNSKLGFSGHGFEPKSGLRNGFVGNADNGSGSGGVGGAYPPPLSQGSSASSSGTSEFESQTPPPVFLRSLFVAYGSSLSGIRVITTSIRYRSFCDPSFRDPRIGSWTCVMDSVCTERMNKAQTLKALRAFNPSPSRMSRTGHLSGETKRLRKTASADMAVNATLKTIDHFRTAVS
ncbi:hypothetical protein Cgig2_025660 [Carnegiea gigantea]|uniref:Ninja-family protein n=1 Tax=Carnegiea gigantea TaxID=171969 RepID=A0A9Q1Q657_9CARY|nr:hypothetical protein Cgig2_025660 [Carnegiea gigantea]